AGLPVISTAGDTLAERIEARRLGDTVPPEDPGAVARAIVSFADKNHRESIAQRVRQHAGTLTWKAAAAPLVRFCAAPHRPPAAAAPASDPGRGSTGRNPARSRPREGRARRFPAGPRFGAAPPAPPPSAPPGPTDPAPPPRPLPARGAGRPRTSPSSA